MQQGQGIIAYANRLAISMVDIPYIAVFHCFAEQIFIRLGHGKALVQEFFFPLVIEGNGHYRIEIESGSGERFRRPAASGEKKDAKKEREEKKTWWNQGKYGG